MAKPMNERERRELAAEHRDSVVAGSANAIEPRRLGQVVSLRFEPETLATLRDIANQRGVTISDLLREGAAMVIAANEQVMQVTHFSVGVHVAPARIMSASSGMSPSGNVGGEVEVEQIHFSTAA